MPEPQRYRNIILLMADQLTPFLTGAYGHPVVQTPNLDRLVRSGIRFDSAYSPYPVCAPARAALMTGRYASRIGAYDNAAPFGSEEPTIAHYLARAGLDTVLSGKMHFIGPDQLHGFATRLTTDIYPAGFKWVPDRRFTGEPRWKALGGMARNYEKAGLGVARRTMHWTYDEETQFRALQYLRSARDPFFLCVSFHHPHEPFRVTQELWDLYEGAHIDIPHYPDGMESTYSQMDRWLNSFHNVSGVDIRDPASLRALRRSYYGLVTYIDRKVGELLDELDDQGLAESTVILFTSDHGDMLGEKGMIQKRHFYEWSARVPLIVSFPDGRAAGTTVSEPVSLIDVLPTLLDIAGIPVEERLALDGRSLIPLIDGSAEERREILSEYHVAGVYAPCFMIRRGSHKYVYVHGHDSQLFDLESDPGEWTNLANRPGCRQIRDDLHARILDHFDPEQIDRAVLESIAKRTLVDGAMATGRVRWDYHPPFDASTQYVR